jgi:hypothetical protein
LGGGLDPLAQAVAVPVQNRRHRPGRREAGRLDSVGASLFQRCRRGQPGGREGSAAGRVLRAVRFRQRPESRRHLGVLLLPCPVSATSGWCPPANPAGALCVQPAGDRVAVPTKPPLRLAGIAPALVQRHRRLERPARRSGHFQTRPFQVFKLGCAQERDGRVGGG